MLLYNTSKYKSQKHIARQDVLPCTVKNSWQWWNIEYVWLLKDEKFIEHSTQCEEEDEYDPSHLRPDVTMSSSTSHEESNGWVSLYQNRVHKERRMFWIEVSEINRAVTQRFSVSSKGDRAAPPPFRDLLPPPPPPPLQRPAAPPPFRDLLPDVY